MSATSIQKAKNTVFNDLNIQDPKEFKILDAFVVKGCKVKNKLGKFMHA